MDWNSPEFVLAIIGIIAVAKLGKHAIYAKRGLVFNKHTDRSDRLRVEPVDTGATARLETDNARLRGEFDQLEKRTRVLERIVTDGGYNVAAQIEALRDVRQVEDQGSGIPLGLGQKERA